MAFATSTIIVMAISAAISIATAAMQYAQASSQAAAQAANQKAAVEAQDRVVQQNAALASEAARQQYTALQNAQAQREEAAAGQKSVVAKKARQVESTTITAAGEAGVGGLGVAQMLRDYASQEATYRLQTDTNLGYARSQTEAEMKSVQLQSEGRINAVQPYQPRPVDYPSFMAYGASAAGNFYNANKDPLHRGAESLWNGLTINNGFNSQTMMYI